MEKDIAFGKKGWKGYLCDTGSLHNGHEVTLMYDYDVYSSRCSVVFKNGDIENTFMRLLKTSYNKTTDKFFKKGELVLIFEPGANDDRAMGILCEDAKVHEFTRVRLLDGKIFLGRTKNFIPCYSHRDEH